MYNNLQPIDDRLIKSLDSIRQICSKTKLKGADYILIAAKMDQKTLDQLANDISGTFKDSTTKKIATVLNRHLATVHELSTASDVSKDYAITFAENIIKEKAMLDYVGGKSAGTSI